MADARGSAHDEIESLTEDLDAELTWTKAAGHLSLEGLEQEMVQLLDHEVVKGILHEGCEVDGYAQEVESKLAEVELDSIQDYITESDTLVEMHDQIRNCDAILEVMESVLGGFQSDLSSISSEIKTLQEQSLSMSVRLRNRKHAEEILRKFIDDIVVPPELIRGIVEGEVDGPFLGFLEQLDTKLVFVQENESTSRTAAYQDVRPELERLRVKAVTKCREFLMQRFYAFRRPKTNIQILQQNVLVKYRYMLQFLRKHGQEVFTEVRACYVDTLSRVLSSHFKAYLAALERLQKEVATRSNLVGLSEVGLDLGLATAGAFIFGRSSTRRQGVEPLALGDRAKILQQLDQSAIIPHVAESHDEHYPYEVLFRSVHKLLLDTATSEYLFCTDFFGEEAVFYELMQSTMSVVEGALNGALQDLFDAVGLLLMIRINHHHQLIMSRRRLPCLDNYLDRVNLLLWPRFKSVLEAHINSLRQASEKVNQSDTGPHAVSCRYAELAAAMHVLNTDYSDQQLDVQLERLESAMMDFLTRASHNFNPRLNGMIFLINNFNHIISTMREAHAAHASGSGSRSEAGEKGALGVSASASLQHFEDQLSGCTSTYVEDQLRVFFEKLIDFVRRAETQQRASGGDVSSELAGAAKPIVADFSRRWKNSIEILHKETSKHFTSSACGMEVLKAAMTQMLLYYTRLLELLKTAGSEGQALTREAVSIPSIMYEIKKLTRT